MAILITGGAGFIGSHTAVEFLNAGYDVVIADNYVNSSPKVLDRIREITGKEFRAYEVDLCDKEALRRVFVENPDIDSAIHFAGLKAVSSTMRLSISTTVSSGNASPRMAAVVRKVLCLPQLKRRGEALTLSSLRSQNPLPATLVPAGPGL